MFNIQEVNQLFPQIYVIRVDNYNNEIENSIDEWIYFLKNSEVKDSFKAKNIEIAKEKLSVLRMTEEEQRKYNAYLEDLMYQKSMFWSARVDGLYEGRAEGEIKGLTKGKIEGLAEGELKGKIEAAKNALSLGLDLDSVAKISGLPLEEIEKIR